MNELTETQNGNPAPGEPDLLSLDLGRWMGRREAFGLMAGRCSAADAESLRRIRDEKIYRRLNCTWPEYCTRHLHVARRSVDRAIGYLQEFGPAFFHLTQLTHIGPKDYRAIASNIGQDGVKLDGTAVTLLPENSQEVSSAVAELLKRIERKQQKPASVPFDAALKRCQTVARMLEAQPRGLDGRQKLDLAAAVAEIGKAAAALGVLVFEP
jgi:hypothetical protein